MNTVKNVGVTAILPLSEMQEGMLIHHLHSQLDEGFLHIEFEIKGELDQTAFIAAWKKVIARHDILRTTVHWDKMEKPLQVIHAAKEAEWNFSDWSKDTASEQRKKIDTLKQENRRLGINFSKNPLNNFHLITLDKQRHYFIWPCHHLILDGWSGSNIIRDVLTYYDGICNNESIQLEPLPSLKSYYAWIKKKDAAATHQFWADYFNGFSKVHLLSSAGAGLEHKGKIIEKVQLTVQETGNLNNFAKQNKITLNTLIQGAWTLLLGVYFNSDDIVFGTTISGRSNDFPNIDKLAGVFTNILPIRGKIEESSSVKEWLGNFQTRQLNGLKYGHVNQNEISSMLNKTAGSVLFDNLLIFENYPSKKIKSGAIEVEGFKSGITSNYPLSLLVLPRTEMVFRFIFQEGQLLPYTRKWLKKNWKTILKALINSEEATIKEVTNSLIPPDFTLLEKEESKKEQIKTKTISPRNDVESKLLSIWEMLLGQKNISVEDNYFEIGGKSLMAVKMVNLIESEFKVKLPITVLLFNPTIASLAKQITGDNSLANTPEWEFLVPLKTAGHKSPVFCIHGGEGHILFYKQMSAYLHEDRPIYLLQPKGIDGEGPMHPSIEQMSKDYISEILQVPDVQNYNLVFYCYSAIVVEICRQFQQMGKEVNLIIIDSWARPISREKKPGLFERLSIYLKTFSRSPIVALKASLISRYRQYLEPLYLRLSKNKIKIQLTRIRKHLSTIYYKYSWEKFDAPCTLIIAEKEHPELKKKKVASWEFWVTSEVKVKYSPGNHFSMFQEPFAQSLAKNIDDACL